MDPVKFGPFLKEARKARGMTQSQLAEKLYVSTAAVSKWERGKSLPDIGKIEDIARALELNVLEVMKCGPVETAAPERELAEVYAETLKAADSQNRRKGREKLAIFLGAALLVLLVYMFPLYRMAEVWPLDFYTTDAVSKLAYIGSREDRAKARRVIAVAEEAFSDLRSTGEEAREKYGPLSRYAIGAERGAVEESHSIRLWSAHFGLSSGSIWVYYSCEYRDAQGDLVSGSWGVASYWVLNYEPGSGQWELNIVEAP